MIGPIAIATAVLAAISDETDRPSLAELFGDPEGALAMGDLLGVSRISVEKILAKSTIVETVLDPSHQAGDYRREAKGWVRAVHPEAGLVEVEIGLAIPVWAGLSGATGESIARTRRVPIVDPQHHREPLAVFVTVRPFERQRAGSDLAQKINYTEADVSTRPTPQVFTDQLTGYFVPVVHELLEKAITKTTRSEVKWGSW